MLFQRLIAVAALVLVSLLGPTASGRHSLDGQPRPQQGTSSPRVTQLPVPRVSLSVSSASTVPGRPITFSAELSSDHPNLRYRFAFGDGVQTGWQTSPVATHSYRAAGKYLAFVDISIGGGSPIGGSVRRAVQVSAAPLGPVDLVANTSAAQPGRAVSMAARVSSNDPQLRYRFAFGDGSAGTDWQVSPHTRHTYRKAGTYAAQVEVGRMTDRGISLLSSTRQVVQVRPAKAVAVSKTAVSETEAETKPTPISTPAPVPTESTPITQLPDSSSKVAAVSPAPTSPVPADTGSRGFPVAASAESDWWKYLLLALLLAFVAYRLVKWASAPKTSIRGVADTGTASVVGEPAIASQVIMHQGVSDARYFVRTDEARIVKSLRRENA